MDADKLKALDKVYGDIGKQYGKYLLKIDND